MASAFATRYAKALADLALKPGAEVRPTDAANQIKAFEEAYRSSSDLRAILLSPAVPGSRKRAVVSKLAAQMGISRLIQNFLFVVVDHRRTAGIAHIREAFESLVDERMGVVGVDVASARDMKDGQRSALQLELSKLTGKQVRVDYVVDSGLLGGAVVKIGSTIYDGSVKGQLEALRRRLASE